MSSPTVVSREERGAGGHWSPEFEVLAAGSSVFRGDDREL